MVACDTKQVTSDRTLGNIEALRPQHGQKSVLHDIIGCATTTHAGGVLVETALIAAEQLAECRFIPLSRSP